MEFSAHCTATLQKNGTTMVLLKFPRGHLMGELPKEIGELRSGIVYRVVIEEEEIEDEVTSRSDLAADCISSLQSAAGDDTT